MGKSGMAVGDVGLLVCGGWVSFCLLLGFGSAMEDAGWTLTLFLSRQLVGVLGSGDTCRRQLLCLHVPGTGLHATQAASNRQLPRTLGTGRRPLTPVSSTGQAQLPVGAAALGCRRNGFVLPCRQSASRRSARLKRGIERTRRGAGPTLTYGRVGQGLDPHAREGEAGRERCRPERLSIAWME